MNIHGKYITLHKKIAYNLATNVDNTIKEIKDKFKEDGDRAMQILEALRQRRVNAFNFKEFRTNQIYEIITNATSQCFSIIRSVTPCVP